MKQIRALIVEDEGLAALNEHQMMIDMGYEVTNIVCSGDAAIIQEELDRPDLILMDIGLQGNIDGIEAARIIKMKRNTPIIYVTAYGDRKRFHAKKYTVPDGFGYVVKPFTKEDLFKEIDRLLPE